MNDDWFTDHDNIILCSNLSECEEDAFIQEISQMKRLSFEEAAKILAEEEISQDKNKNITLIKNMLRFIVKVGIFDTTLKERSYWKNFIQNSKVSMIL